MTTTLPLDAAKAQRKLAEAEQGIRSALRQIRETRRLTIYRRIRLFAARGNIPAWIAALVIGSAMAFLIALPAIFVFGFTPGLLAFTLLLAYLVAGGASFYVFRDIDGETDETVVQVREAALASSLVMLGDRRRAHTVATHAAARARFALAEIHQEMQSEAYRHQVEANRLLAIDPGQLYPDDFERYTGDIFKLLGYVVEVTGRAGDQGTDVLACKGSIRIAVQAKRYAGSVGNGGVQEAYAGQAHHRCHRCMVITTGYFTTSAVELARSTGCTLVGRDEIPAMIRGELGL